MQNSIHSLVETQTTNSNSLQSECQQDVFGHISCSAKMLDKSRIYQHKTTRMSI